MRRCLIPFALALAACPTNDEPRPVAPIEGAYGCGDEVEGPVWDFEFAASGPADEAGAEMRIFTDDVPNEFAYSLEFEGANGTARADYSFRREGTPAGEDPSPGDVPFSCEDVDDVQVVFCARSSITLESLCWACEGEPGATLPSGAEGWVGCTSG